MKIRTFFAVAVTIASNHVFANTEHQTHQHLSDAEQNTIELIVYKTPTCGCCKKWIDHINDQGMATQSRDYRDISFIKQELNIRPNHRSCHTAVTHDGFAFEGHVPGKYIRQFLTENHPEAIGLSVPAMPVGSPGMEMAEHFMPYQILILYKDGSSEVYAQVSHYEEQF
ncbi:DUF411 domain-containing protein [Thalassotalea mangrovi]|uniref:DUF411 domain-containing protein n=1 Tax=Thalassotalea mangrovi TaxID=2572245 RepID=A0A4U1B9I6_9GAMM|nr:DUF411 domain-containing protein [Thalassotalea mangrovi]TKB47430.1 DUF411 domain-containing protein [Thalassotalea mangrovi]